MTIILVWKWCKVCMELTPQEWEDGRYRCTLADHAERAEWHKKQAKETMSEERS